MKGTELRKIRKNLKLTQTEFAEELKIKRITISRLERGEYTISKELEQRVDILNSDSKQADAHFTLLKEMVGPLTTRDILTTVTSLTPDEIRKAARSGSPFKINKK